MLRKKINLAAVAALFVSAGAMGEVATVYYTVDMGGWNTDPLNGMQAMAIWESSGTDLSILLQNTSTGVPVGAQAADSLLVSVAFSLLDGVEIASGNTAVIGAGSYGLGLWSGLGPGDSVAQQWLWTNDFGGDMLDIFAQIISTSSGQGGGASYLFGGGDPNVSGPFGGIAADPPFIAIPDSKPAVANSILFTLTLTDELLPGQLQHIADRSVVEYGSDFQYLSVPAPATVGVLLLSLGLRRRRR